MGRWVRFAIVAALLVWLAQRGALSLRNLGSVAHRWDRLALALAANLLLVVLTQVRWWVILRSQGLGLGLGSILRLGLAGGFFNLALPGGVSGDVFKAHVLGAREGASRSRVLGGILYDRVCGLSALVLVGWGALSLFGAPYRSNPLFATVAWGTCVLGVAVLGFYGVLCIAKVPSRWKQRWADSQSRWGQALGRFLGALSEFAGNRSLVGVTVALSLGIHLLGGWSCWNLLLALGVDQLSFGEVLMVFPLGTLVNLFPLAPGGIGTGHAAFLFFFRLLGVEVGADLFTLLAAITIGFGLCGGLFYFGLETPAKSKGAPVRL